MSPEHEIFCGTFQKYHNLCVRGRPLDYSAAHCVFADPPDNLGLQYDGHSDRMSQNEYAIFMGQVVRIALSLARISWISYNAKWTYLVGGLVSAHLKAHSDLEAKPCVQVFTFGQHNQHDLGSSYRPLVRLRWDQAAIYPDNIRVKSWRQENGDKRANPAGRIPGDVFDFPRVTGNSRQRRPWCPTQLHERLVERCILLSTKPGDIVIDLCAGTGTTLRACKRINRRCILIEKSEEYCKRIAKEHGLKVKYLDSA